MTYVKIVLNDRKVILLLQSLILALLLGVWQLLGTRSANVYFYVGTPSAIAKQLWILLSRDDLMMNFAVTGGEALLGLLFGTIIGSIFGLSLWYSETLTRVLRPFVLAIGTLPIFAFAPLMIVWFGIGFWMKVAMATFSTVFVAFNQAHNGAVTVASVHVDTLRGMNAAKTEIFLKAIVPGSIDWVLGSMRLNVGFSLLGAFIGEFISAQEGLGYLILRAAGLYNIPRAFAAAIGIVVLALLLDNGARFVERRKNVLVQWISVPRTLWK